MSYIWFSCPVNCNTSYQLQWEVCKRTYRSFWSMALGRLEIRTAILTAALYIYSEFSVHGNRTLKDVDHLNISLCAPRYIIINVQHWQSLGNKDILILKRSKFYSRVKLDMNYLLTEKFSLFVVFVFTLILK